MFLDRDLVQEIINEISLTDEIDIETYKDFYLNAYEYGSFDKFDLNPVGQPYQANSNRANSSSSKAAGQNKNRIST